MAPREDAPSETPSTVVKHSHRALIQIIIAFAVLIPLIPFDLTLATYWFTIVFLWSFLMYLLGKAQIRARARELPSDLARSWYLIVLVVLGVQTCVTLIQTYVLPEVGEQAMRRLPIDPSTHWLGFLLIVGLYGPAAEEFFFRGIVQEHLSGFVPDVWANVLTSALFAFIHWFPGPISSIAIDLLFVFISSMFYGLIYSRTRNVLTSIVAHSGFNLYGAVLFLF